VAATFEVAAALIANSSLPTFVKNNEKFNIAVHLLVPLLSLPTTIIR